MPLKNFSSSGFHGFTILFGVRDTRAHISSQERERERENLININLTDEMNLYTKDEK